MNRNETNRKLWRTEPNRHFVLRTTDEPRKVRTESNRTAQPHEPNRTEPFNHEPLTDRTDNETNRYEPQPQ